MTDQDKRLLVRGMSIASGLLINAQCPHRGVITAYQKALAGLGALTMAMSLIARNPC